MLFGDTLIFIGNATYQDFDDGNTYSLNLNNLKVEEGVTGTMRCDSRCENRIKLFGKGTLKIYVPWIRSDFTGDWSAFEGTIEPSNPRQLVRLEQQLWHAQGYAKHPERTTVSNTAKPYTPWQSDRKRNLNRRQQHLAYRFVERRFLFPRQDRRHRHATD